MKFWLLKSEPEVFSIDDLARVQVTAWEGVRNYQARNFMWHDMRPGDWAFFYHSNAEPSGIVGLMKIDSVAHADESQFQKKSEYYDAKATREEPRWFCVDCRFVEKFAEPLALSELRSLRGLEGLLLLQKGSRLSVQPVLGSHFLKICEKVKSAQLAEVRKDLSRKN